MKKYSLLVVLFVAFFTSCQKQTNSKGSPNDLTVVAKVVDAKNTLNYEGNYKGILPCADCEGIETTVCLNENSTYTIRTTYIGKGNKIFEQKGTFSWNKAGNIVTFDNVENAPNQYEVAKNTLTQLDMSGKKITGNHATDYILAKQKAGIENAVNTDDMQTTVNLNNKMEAKTVIKKVNPAVGKVTLAETHWKLMKLNGKTIKQKGKKIYGIKLNSKDGRFTGYAGCNNFSGNYVMPSAFGIAFVNVVSTEMACLDMEVESHFSKVLQNADRYTLNDNILQLKKGKKEVLATFEPAK
ncbi:copper resistance protein NlpE N-terminal domain-containing protein [Flavobacterium phycosphaerae]|uniref:copper resistance protein NlpE N-terminal domain-containing protein n=1 Tax=Flavobacterium phycosphaerae TaxID=2697515 RepID=UPI001389D11D|nr:copper resistance protein NlpE N-terminal domain-containing protein [Flavobacterium phycosphaerae]